MTERGKVVNFVCYLDNYMQIFVPKNIGTGEVYFYSINQFLKSVIFCIIMLCHIMYIFYVHMLKKKI